jgi:outer membrane immunogenic protein
MIRALSVAATLVLISNASFAADLLNYSPPPASPISPAFSWTGFHIGVSGGYGFNADDPGYSFINVPPQIISLLPKSASLDADGALVGGAVGFDKQFGQFVLGVEGDMSWTDFGGDATHIRPSIPSIQLPSLKFETDYHMDWLSTVRGRAGITFDQWMLYGTGGLALANVSLKSSVTLAAPANGELVGSDDKTKTGWTAGGGAAFALTDHISLKAEGLYYDLGHISVHSTDPRDPQGSVLVTNQDINGVIARGGVDYRF